MRSASVSARLVAVALVSAALAGARGAEPPAEQTVVPYDSKALGAVQVKGDTRDWFTVYQGNKRVGPSVPPLLNSTVELPPGTYQILVNKTERKVTVEAGKKVVLLTGTLVVEGNGASW